MITKMIPKTIVCEDFAAMSLESAKLMASAVKARPDALLSLAAGNTAIEAYRCLKDMADRGEIDFSKAKFVALDEWLDLKDESENCISFMFKNFYGPLKIPRENITLFDVHADDLQKECSRIDQVIFDHGGIDFVLLGAGMNGHLGLNEPGSDFNGYTKVAELDPVTMQVGQKYFSKQTALTRGITLGIRHFTESKNVVLQIGTAQKADIVEKLYRSEPTPNIPATVIKQIPGATVVLDRDAAANITDLLEK